MAYPNDGICFLFANQLGIQKMNDNFLAISLITLFLLSSLVLIMGRSYFTAMMANVNSRRLCMKRISSDRSKRTAGVYASYSIKYKQKVFSGVIDIGNPRILSELSDLAIINAVKKFSGASFHEVDLQSIEVSKAEVSIYVVSEEGKYNPNDATCYLETSTICFPNNPFKTKLHQMFS